MDVIIKSKAGNIVLLLLLLYCAGCATAQVGKEGLLTEPVTVFEPDDLYVTTRIPALVSTPKGALLAFCEARANSTSDWAEIDLIMRRSTDGGRTWTPPVVIAQHEKDKLAGNPTPIVTRDGTVHLVFQRDYARAYHMKSTDDGNTWSAPADITYAFDAFRPEYNWRVIAPGPGHAIQLTSGRLLVPVWICEPDPATPRAHHPSCVATVYSDDAGVTWKRGEIISCKSDTIRNPSECVAAELADGSVLINIRHTGPSQRRGISRSVDGARQWSTPVIDTALYEPVCMASMLAVKEPSALLFANPDSEHLPVDKSKSIARRKNLTVKLSTDGGRSWKHEKVLEPGNAGYSDLATGADGRIYCLYETNEAEGWKYRIVLKTFSIRWITAGK